jgi:hypothetical protein
MKRIIDILQNDDGWELAFCVLILAVIPVALVPIF